MDLTLKWTTATLLFHGKKWLFQPNPFNIVTLFLKQILFSILTFIVFNILILPLQKKSLIPKDIHFKQLGKLRKKNT